MEFLPSFLFVMSYMLFNYLHNHKSSSNTYLDEEVGLSGFAALEYMFQP